MMTTLQPIERVAALLKPTQLMLDWINENSDEEDAITLEEAHADATIILLPLFEDEEQTEEYLSDIYLDIFEGELESWDENEETWPKERSLDTFLEWFEIEIHSLVKELGETMLTSRNRKTMLQ